MHQRILVGLDGSPSAERAIRLAGAIAQRSHAEIRLIHVLDLLQSGYVSSLAPDAWASDHPDLDAREYLVRLAHEIRTRWNVRVTVDVLKGDAADQLVSAADGFKADLLVLTSHGHGPLKRLWLGSVADRVMREATPPVLLVPINANALAADRFSHVLAPLDGSQLAERALYGAATLADLFGAKLSLLRIVEVAPQVDAVPVGVGVFPVAIVDTATLEQTAAAYLTDVASAYKFLAPIIATDVLVDVNPPAQLILDYASDHKVDLIAIATHGEGGIRRLVLGSTADKLIRSGEIPVLVYKAQEAGAVRHHAPTVAAERPRVEVSK